jgi:adenylate kinase
MLIQILLGPPGVGKGTQAELLAKKYELIPLSTGAILRSSIKKQTELGKRVSKVMNDGGLVPDELVCSLVEDELSSKKDHKGFILDGFPRTLSQAESLDKLLLKHKLDNLFIISLKLNPETVIKRTSSRIFCKECNTAYNTVSKPTKIFGVCDKCSSTEFYTRDDDKLETVKKRLDQYEKSTSPLIHYYKDYKGYLEVDADQNIEKVQQTISNFIKY